MGEIKAKKFIPWFIALILIPGALFADQTIEELEKKLEKVSGKEKVEVLNKLSYAYRNTSAEKILEYGNQALTLSRVLNDLKGEAEALNNTALGYMMSGKLEESLENAKRSFEIFEKLGDKRDIGRALHLLGNVYYQLSNLDISLEYFQKALKLREEIGSKKEIASTLGNIAVIYKRSGKVEKDLEYQLSALKIREEIGDENGIAISLDNIARVYRVEGESKKALEYFRRSLEISERLENKSTMAITLEGIGITYTSINDFPKALEYFLKSLKVNKEIGSKTRICSSLNNVGDSYLELENYLKALDYFREALKLAEEIRYHAVIPIFLNNIGKTYMKFHDYDKSLEYLEKSMKINRDNGNEINYDTFGILSGLYSAKGDYKNALEYFKRYAGKKVEKINSGNREKATEMRVKYETLEKEKEIEDFKKNNKIQELILNRQIIIRNAAIIISVLLIIIFFQFFRRYRYLFSFWKKKNYIAHYRLVDKIGSGGMGDIYKAQDIQGKSRTSSCAIKVLKEEYYKDEKYKTRFKNEAAMIDQLHHPNIVKVMERGEFEGTLYIAMELLEGETLADLLEKEEQIDLKIALSMMIQMTSAMVEIHKRGIIHRDLKPENIMVVRTAENSILIKVLDFGLARTQNLTRLTRTGMIMGTIFYVSPEQLSRSKILPAGDIYSLGVIYYQVLTGEKPFAGDTAFDIARRILKKEPVKIGTFQPDIPADLSSLIERMMAKAPERRPLANEILKQLKEIEKSTGK